VCINDIVLPLFDDVLVVSAVIVDAVAPEGEVNTSIGLAFDAVAGGRSSSPALASSLEGLVAAVRWASLLETPPFPVRPVTAPDASLHPLSQSSL